MNVKHYAINFKIYLKNFLIYFNWPEKTVYNILQKSAGAISFSYIPSFFTNYRYSASYPELTLY
jgi:hypothetical protein